MRVDPRSREASLDGPVLELTPLEFDLLYYLAARAWEVVSKRELMTEVWQLPYGARTRPSMCTWPGCATSSASPPPTPVTCTPSGGRGEPHGAVT